MAEMTTSPNRRPRRSMKLTTEQYKLYKQKVDSFDTKYDAALFFGFTQVTLENILLRKSGREQTINCILEKIGIAA